MKWSINPLEKIKAVHLIASGSMDLEHFKKMNGEALKRMKELGIKKLIIDIRNLVPDMDREVLNSLPDVLMHLGLVENQKTAVVYSPTAPGAEMFGALADMLTQQHDFKIFTDMTDATDWLH